MAPDDRSKIVLVTEDSFAALIRVFKLSPKFNGYSESTRDLWGRELDHMSHPDCLGTISLQAIRPALVQAYFDGLTGRSGKQAAALAALKQLEKFAVVRDLLPRQITTGIEIPHDMGGHTPWTDEHVEVAEKNARDILARVVILGTNTGQRGSDLVRMGWTNVETYNGIDGINVTQMKTGKKVWLPITRRLAEAMKGWERRPGPFLHNQVGQPWERKALTDAWTNERDKNPALAPLKAAGLVLHGMRGCACVRLRRAGATPIQIADMVGMSVPMVERYCRLSSQRDNAVAAVIHLDRTIREHKFNMSNKGGS